MNNPYWEHTHFVSLFCHPVGEPEDPLVVGLLTKHVFSAHWEAFVWLYMLGLYVKVLFACARSGDFCELVSLFSCQSRQVLWRWHHTDGLISHKQIHFHTIYLWFIPEMTSYLLRYFNYYNSVTLYNSTVSHSATDLSERCGSFFRDRGYFFMTRPMSSKGVTKMAVLWFLVWKT